MLMTDTAADGLVIQRKCCAPRPVVRGRMFTFPSSISSHRRRSFLKAGALGVGSLTLADLLRAESAAGVRSSTKAVINIHLDGGPPQMDLIDPKPDAPSEIRGEFKSLPTKIPGLHLTELLPRLGGERGQVCLPALAGAARRAITTRFSASQASVTRICPSSADVRRWAAW
jgi:hypothetical protein